MSVFRHAFRPLIKSPGFSLIAILLLGVGIGATSAIFTIVNSVLLRPIDYPDSDSLVVIRQSRLPEFPTLSVCPADYFDFRTRSDAFSHIYAARGDSMILTGRGEPRPVRILRATVDMFATLGLAPDRGRAFTADEDTPGADRVAVLLHDFWVSQLGGRSDLLGQTLTLNGQPTTIIGVMPAKFRTDPVSDMIIPMAFTAEEATERGLHHIRVVARLGPEATLTQANQQLAAISDQLAEEYPTDNVGWSAFAVPLLDWHTRGARSTLYLLFGAVAFLLLITCANVGNLVLVRATARHHEISLRMALGASRWHLMRMLLAESLVLGLIGGAVGLLLAHWGLDAILALGGEHIPRAAEIELDQRVVVFTFGLSLLTGLIFGLTPVGRMDASQLIASLKSGPRGTDDDLRHHSIRQWLIVAEIALALILLNTAGVFGRSFLRLSQIDPGFNPEGAWWVRLEMPPERYDTAAKQATVAEKWAQSLSEQAGVSEVAFASVMPFTGSNQVMRVEFRDRVEPPSYDESAYYFATSPGYFETMQIPLLAGRTFTADDRVDTPRVAIVSQSFARRFFPGRDPLGQQVNITKEREPRWRTVVGVVADVKQHGLDQKESVQIYEPFAQMPAPYQSFVIRYHAGELARGASIRRAVHAIDADQAVFSIRPVRDLIADSIARRRFALVIMGVFSLMALLIASFGVYGVISFSVATRTREIGVRMALGAQSKQVLKVVMKRGMQFVGWGVLMGTLASLALGQLLVSELHATSSHDPMVLVSAAAFLALLSAVACWIPARQATRVNPIVAIGTE